jgi:hypothetical protein
VDVLVAEPLDSQMVGQSLLFCSQASNRLLVRVLLDLPIGKGVKFLAQRSALMGMPVDTPRTWRFGVFELDALSGELRRNGTVVKLREQPLVLAQLIEEFVFLGGFLRLRRRRGHRRGLGSGISNRLAVFGTAGLAGSAAFASSLGFVVFDGAASFFTGALDFVRASA